MGNYLFTIFAHKGICISARRAARNGLGAGRAGAVAIGVGLSGRMTADIAREVVPRSADSAMSDPCRHRTRSAAFKERRAGSTVAVRVRVEARLDSAAVARQS